MRRRCKRKVNKRIKRIALTIGRYQFAHRGHINYLKKLISEFDLVYIGIGSYYEHGTIRNPFLGIFREKMLRKALAYEGVDMSKIRFLGVQDYATFELWLEAVFEIRDKFGITHFVTGNAQDILDPINERGLNLGMKIVNPEIDSEVRIHASDIRHEIKAGNIVKALDMLHPTVVDTLAETNMMETLIRIQNGESIADFVEGRQSVDVVLTVRDKTTKKLFTVLGNRSMQKVDFPGVLALPGGAIDKYETVIEAAIRELHEETGLELKRIHMSSEPELCLADGIAGLVKLSFIDIYGDSTKSSIGSYGGSTQVLSVHFECDVTELSQRLRSESDLSNVRVIPVDIALQEPLAYQHGQILYDTLTKTARQVVSFV